MPVPTTDPDPDLADPRAAAGGEADTLAEVIEDVATLVAVESPSSDLAALAASAQVLAGLGEARLGSAPEVLAVDGVPHVRWRLGDGPRRVLLLGHHDTVWPLGTLADLPFRVDDGVMRGPGCFDMKAGIVLALHAVADVARTDPAGVDGITLLVTGDEEVGSTTSRALIEEEAAAHDAVLVCEQGMADGAVKVARKGVALYTITAHGHAAHAGLDPDDGVNALVELAHQVPRIAALGDPATGTTVTPTLAAAGTTVNTVPDRAHVEVDVRVPTDAEQARVDAAMQALEPVLEGARLEVSGGANRPPMDPETGAELATLATDVADRLGLELPTRAVGGASDGNFTAGIGIPTLDGLGPAGGGAHARSEHVLVDSLLPRRRLLAGLLTALRS